eukprot:TRINITY_DN1928_c0_g1_i1.p1 TRINITY_DN1928_c0_g1~~TRINITY_DN1928_c0_g1_i1.p1  ORF type:complete len:430 (-),score=156.64 TRINITY_DN1928_c0_g1_i1:49-1338(-)
MSTKVEQIQPIQDTENNNLWRNILQNASKEKYSVPSKTVLIVGDAGSGKASLISRIHKLDFEDSITKGMGLDYSYDDIYDNSQDLVGRINFWRLEGEDMHKHLTKFVVNEQTIEDTLIVITLDLSSPWNLVQSLNKWLKIISDMVENVLKNMQLEKKQQLQQKLISLFQHYVDPQQQKEENVQTNNTNIHTTPLTEGALTENLGITILVVVCKTETTENLEKENGYRDSEFEYIQQYLRRICLKHGASLIYTSAKKNVNCDLLKKYIQHLSFHRDFKEHAQVVDKSEIFVPIGWDSNAKIKIDFENQKVCDDPLKPFEDFIKAPSKKKSEDKNFVVAENEQAFLLRHSTITPTMMRDTLDTSTNSPLSTVGNNESPLVSKSKSTTPSVTPIKSSSSGLSNDNDHEKLANFFNDLLMRKKTTPKKGGDDK